MFSNVMAVKVPALAPVAVPAGEEMGRTADTKKPGRYAVACPAGLHMYPSRRAGFCSLGER
jgi:hypothetical protein